MKKHGIRILSFFLVLVTIVGVFPLGVFATEKNTASEASTSVDTSSVEIEGGGLGTLISNALEDETATEEDDANIENKILEVTMEEDMAFVEFNNTVECKIIVSLYDENTGAMLCSGIEENIEPHMGSIYVAIDTETMPDFYILKAFLLDMDNVALHRSYENTHYTTEFQEFLAKTTDDFAEEDILNLDTNKENNFAVFAEGTITITQSECNILESADEENFVYTFSNVNEEITSLKNGDAVYFENDETFVLFLVDTVTVDGTTATIRGQEDIALDMFFSYVKIDSTIPEEDEPATYGIGERGFNVDKSCSTSVDVNINYKTEEDVSSYGEVKITGIAVITAELRIYLSKNYFELYAGIAEEARVMIDVKGTLTAYEEELGEFSIPLFAGVAFVVEPKFVIDFNIEISGYFVQTSKIAFEYNTNCNKVNNKSVPFKADFEFEVNGRFYIGIKLDTKISLLKCLYAGVTGEIGGELSGKTFNLNTDSEQKHSCALCIDGQLNIIGSFGVELELKIFKLSIGIGTELFKRNYKLYDFYYSDIFGFGKGKCPNISYKVDLLVIDGNGNPVPGVSANGVVTNEKGIVELGYLSKDRYTLTLEKDTFEKSYTIDVDRAGTKTVVFNLTNYTDESYFKYIINNGEARITGFDKTLVGEVYIPKTLGGYPVTRIGGDLFFPSFGLDSVTKIVIPNTVKEIADNAFYGCTNLVEVVIPDGVSSIGYYAFEDCVKLKKIELPSSILSIDPHAFTGCNLVDIIISKNNSVYKSVDGVVFSKDGTQLCFFPSSKELTSYTVPSNVISIQENAFYNNKNLREIILPEGLIKIGKTAFFLCRNLENIYIPNDVSEIGEEAFRCCYLLKSIQVSALNQFYKSLDGVLYNKECTTLLCYPCGKTDVVFVTPPTVKEIYKRSFCLNNYLTYLSITSGVEQIGENAFSNCANLNSIIIPNTVKKIDWDAFFYSNNLKDLYYEGSRTEWEKVYQLSYGNLVGTTMHYNYTPSETVAYASYAPDNVYTNDYEFTSFITEYDLVPGAVYTLMILRSEGDLTTDNLIYITDTVADEIGTAEFSYVCETPSDEFTIIVTGPCNHSISDWITVYEPTSSDVGVQVKLCSKCDTVIEQEDIPMLPALPGDATEDDKVNLADVSLILKYIAKWDVALDTEVADVTDDGKVNLADVSLLLKYIAKWDVVLK